LSKDGNSIVLCYFKNGSLQTHPRLSFDRKAKMIRIRSAVDSISARQRYIEVECNKKGFKRTYYFVDGIKKEHT